MRPKERCRIALNHQEPDRVPMNYHADGNMSKKLKKYFGITENKNRNCWLTGNEDPQLLEALDCDFRALVPEYIGPPIKINPDGSFISILGEHLLIRENPDGSAYFEYPILPLADAKSIEEVDAHPWPKVEWFDFSVIKEQLEEWEDYAIISGDMGTLDCINRCLMLFGYERVMIGMAERDPVLFRAFQHISNFYYDYMKHLFEAGGKQIDIAYYGEDLGTQNGPRISLEMHREIIQPLWKRHIELAKKYGYFTMQHSCGSTRAFYPEFIKMGIDIHDTVQLYTANMNPEEIKREFGKKLCFHGGISIQRVLQTGTKEEVAEEVRRVIDALAPNGGYILAPTHWIQSGTPIENILAMYQTAKEYSTEFYRKRKGKNE